MEENIEPKTYELAYHLNSDLEETGAKSHMLEINDLVTQGGGSIMTSRELKKIHLSYPVKKKSYAYFGLINFTALPETIEKLNAQMKLQNNVMRYLLIAKPKEKELRILGQYRARSRAIKTHEPITAAEIQKKPLKEKTKEETEQLEKDIEKVIEGL